MIPMFSGISLTILLATLSTNEIEAAKYLINLGVAGCWILALQQALKRIYKDMVSRDNKRHEENQVVLKKLVESGAEHTPLMVSLLEQVGNYSPSVLKKMISNAGEHAEAVIRESRAEKNETHL